jgi:hypothetical protein
VMFRRDLYGLRLTAWNALLLCLKSIQLSEVPDKFRWNLQFYGKFTVNSLYNVIIQLDIPVDKNKKIWKINFFNYFKERQLL